MIRSMTGFGEAELDTPLGRLRAEVRSVNHRYFSANLRLARQLERYEPQVREWLRGFLPRGHVSFSLRLEAAEADGASAGPPLQVDGARAARYLTALKSLQEHLDLPGEIDIALLSRFGDLITPAEDEGAEPLAAGLVERVTAAAARAAVAMRNEEGSRLATDLDGRLTAIEQALGRIALRAPVRLVVERDRIRRVVSELLAGIPLDEERVAREVAFLAERWDVSEELVRLHSHIALFRATMLAESEEPVGKRLGFLSQEMNREANTIGAKANDAAIEHEVIAIKDEIERLREQIENVE
jgi:uncharacterized protein (TIGR00255 family)